MKTSRSSLPCSAIAVATFLSLSQSVCMAADNPNQAPASPALFENIGDTGFAGWNGVTPKKDGSASWALSQKAVFSYPNGPNGWHHVGFRAKNDSTRDWSNFYGVQFEMMVPKGRTLELRTTVAIPPVEGRSDYSTEHHASCRLTGDSGWQKVTLPWSAFDYPKSQGSFLHYIQTLSLSAQYADGKTDSTVQLKNVHLVRAQIIAMEASVLGKSAQPDEAVTYDVSVGNCTDTRQNLRLAFDSYGWETMIATVEPEQVSLAPGESARCTVTVKVPECVAPGGHETQTLMAIGSGGAIATLAFVTARDVPRPMLLHTAAEWKAIREKVKQYAWAKKMEQEYVKTADDWKVPEAAKAPNNVSSGHKYVFNTAEFIKMDATAIAWQLTQNTNYAEKVAIFLRRLADEKTGYPGTFAAVHQGEPQEGENFQRIAMGYDAILDAGVLSDADRQSIEHTFRLYLETIEPGLQVGNIGNWNVAGAVGGLFCSLTMGDLSLANRYLYGPGGFTDYVTKGIMDDGWWWEGSTSYNFWVASELTQSALACQWWGIDLLNRQFPANFSPHTIITPWGLTTEYGMSFEKWGANRRNTRSVKQLWDAVPEVADYRAIAFGMNDGHEEPIGGSRMELAYYAFHDPAYVPLIKASGKRDLLYGVPELPEVTDKPYLKSNVAENLGFALMRSQTTNCPPRDQIQAVFKIGSEGGYHGHFDRCSLNTIMRYGRSWWSPETIWWGYGNFMYKFYVQNSVNHNMVVVDQKQQEAVPSKQLIFYPGKMIQVSAQETDARWSTPPYGGMVYGAGDSGGATKSLSDMMKRNKQSFPLVNDLQWGKLGPFGDRVLQRRVGIVTSDYIVIADYLKSEDEHTFDNLFQMKDFKSLEAPEKQFIRHEAQFNSDPRSSAQFITDCDWYQVSAPSVARFVYDFQPGPDRQRDHNESGLLKMDIHSLWPKQQEIMLAQPAENLGGQQWVRYEVSADGQTVAQGETGVWILGEVDLDVPVKGVKELTIKLTTSDNKEKTLFLANARCVSADDKETALNLATADNIASPPKQGRDYAGGPIKIAGQPYAEAIPAQPDNSKEPGVIHLSLAGKNAVRFKATLGGDYPVGDESGRRRIYASRSHGTEAQFLTLIEPYENKSVIKSAEALSANKIRVELADGRVQEITINNLEGNGLDISAKITETKEGRSLREESTSSE